MMKCRISSWQLIQAHLAALIHTLFSHLNYCCLCGSHMDKEGSSRDEIQSSCLWNFCMENLLVWFLVSLDFFRSRKIIFHCHAKLLAKAYWSTVCSWSMRSGGCYTCLNWNSSAMLSPSLPVDQGQFQSQKQCLEGTWKVCEILVYMVVQSFSFMCHSGLIWCPFSISVSSYFCCFVCMLHICGWV